MKNLKAIVTQNYALVNAKYKLTSNEMKFLLLAIAQIDSKDDKVLRDYEIRVSELEEKFQAEQNETRLRQFAKKLMSKPLEVPTQRGWLIANWFSDIEYITSEARFIVRFSEKLKPYLLELKERFTPYNLKNILPLTSAYSIRIYQLLKEYENLEKRTFILEELQEILQVPKSYKIYSKFKQGILEVAEKELKEHCDIYFTFSEKKRGRKVSEIVFKIHSKVKKEEQRDVIEVHKQSNFKNYLKSISPFYFQNKAYKINDKCYLMQGKRILTTEDAKRMYKTLQDNINALVPCSSIDIFDAYESKV